MSEATIVQLKIEYKKITPIIISLRREMELKIETKTQTNLLQASPRYNNSSGFYNATFGIHLVMLNSLKKIK